MTVSQVAYNLTRDIIAPDVVKVQKDIISNITTDGTYHKHAF